MPRTRIRIPPSGPPFLVGDGFLNVAAGSVSSEFSALTLANSNGVTFGLNTQGVITASINATAAVGNVNFSAGSTSSLLSAVTFQDGNGISFGLNGNVMTGSAAPNINISAGTTSRALSNLVLSNSNGVSFGLNGSTVTGSVAAQTNQSLGLFAVGNTTQSSSTTADARSLSFDGLGGASVGFSNGSVQISAPTTAGLLSALNLSAGTTSQNLSAFVLSNSNNVSFGLNGSTITASASAAAQTNQTLGLFAVGNTTQSSSTTVDARSLSFDGLGGISVGYSNGSVQISGPTSAAGSLNLSAGTTSQNLSNFVLSNSNGVSFGLNGSTVTGSVAAQTNQSLGLFAVGNTTQSSSTTADARSLSFDGLGGISVGYSNGSIQISGPSAAGAASFNLSAGTTSQNLTNFVLSNSNGVSFGLNGSTVTGSVAAQTNQSLGLFAVGNTTQSSSTTADARSLSFDGLGGASVGFSNGSVQISAPTTAGLLSAMNLSAGTTSQNLSAFVLSNSNNVSFGLNGSTITASASAAAQTNQTLGLFAVGNTTQSSSTTADARSLSFDGLGGISVGYSNGSIQISGPSAAGAASFNLSAGTTSQNLTNFVLSNSNGVSFGLNGSTVTGSVAAQTNQSLGIFAVGNTTQSSSTTADARSLSFDGLGGASVGFSNGSVQISAPTTAGLLSALNLSAGTTSQNLSAFVMSNSNGVSFGLNGSTVTGSVAAQTNQSLGLFAVGNTTQSSSTTADARSLSFDGLGGASVGFSNGSVQISAPTTAGLLSALNLSAGTTSQNLSAFVLSNSNNISFGLNGSTITASASAAAQTNQSLGLFAVGNTTQSSSTTADARSLSFDGLGGASVGFSNGSVQISAPTTAGLLSALNLSAGTTSQNLSAFVMSNSNGVSFGLNGSTVTGSVAAQTNQSLGLFAVGNTTQSSSTTADARSLSFDGLGGISVGYSNGSIQISGPSAAGAASFNLSAGTTSQNLTNFVLSNSNGVSFGLNGSTVTGSVAAQTNQSLGLFAVGNTTQSSSTTADARSLSFDGLGGISIGYSNGSVQISGPSGTLAFSNSNNIIFGTSGSTTVTASAFINASAGTTSQNLSAFTLSNANGVSFGLNGSVITASVQTTGATINVSAGTTSQNLTNFVLSNSNGVSFGLNGSTVTGSVAAQTNQSLGLFAVGNTTQSSSTTADARSLSFDGLGGISVGYSNGSIQISGPSAAGAASFNLSAGTTSQNLTNFVLSNSNGVSFGLNGSTVTGSVAAQTNQSLGLFAVGNTTQSSSTTADARSLSFDGLGGISIGYSNGSIQISGPTAGAGGNVNLSAGTTSQNLTNFVFSNSNNVSFGLNGSTITGSIPNGTVSFQNSNGITFGSSSAGATTTITASIALPAMFTFEPYPMQNTGTAALSAATGTSGSASFFPFVAPAPIAAEWVQLIASFSFVTAGTSKGSQTASHSYAIYSQGTGTNSSTMSSLTGGSFSFGISYSNSTITINQPTTTNSNGYSTGSTTSAGLNITSNYTGLFLMQMPLNSTLTQGQYWLGIFDRQSTSSINCGLSFSFIGNQMTLTNLAAIGSASSGSGTNAVNPALAANWNFGMGVFSSAGQTNLPATVALSAITQNISVVPYMKYLSTS